MQGSFFLERKCNILSALNKEIDKLLAYQQYYRRQELEHPGEAKYTVYLHTIDMCFSFLARMVPKEYLAFEDVEVPLTDAEKICNKADMVIKEFQDLRRDILYHDFWDTLYIMQNLLAEWNKKMRDDIQKRRR